MLAAARGTLEGWSCHNRDNRGMRTTIRTRRWQVVHEEYMHNNLTSDSPSLNQAVHSPHSRLFIHTSGAVRRLHI
jgi:hypothetical protein